METQLIPDIFFDSDDNDDRGEAIASLQVKENSFPLFYGDNIIGRVSVCDVVIDSVEVSDRHAEIHIEKDKATIKDFRSRNGTFVNQVVLKRNEKILLKEGDIIRFGSIDAILCFKNLNKKIPDSSLSEETQEIPDMMDFAKIESSGSANATLAEEPTLLDDVVIENSIHDIVRENEISKSDDDSEVSQDLLCMDTYAGSDSHSSPEFKTTAIRSETISSVPVSKETSITSRRRSHVMSSLLSSSDSDSDTDVEVEAHKSPKKQTMKNTEKMLDKLDTQAEKHDNFAGIKNDIKVQSILSPENLYPAIDTLQSNRNINKFESTPSLEGSNKAGAQSTKTTTTVMNLEEGLEASQSSTDSSPLKLNFEIINSDNDSEDSNIMLGHQEVRNTKLKEDEEANENLLPGLVEAEVVVAIGMKDSKEIVTKAETGKNPFSSAYDRHSNALHALPIHSTNSVLEENEMISSTTTSTSILSSNYENKDNYERSSTVIIEISPPARNIEKDTDTSKETDIVPSPIVASVKKGRGRAGGRKEVPTSNNKTVKPTKTQKEEEEEKEEEMNENAMIFPLASDSNNVISSKESVPDVLTSGSKNNKRKVTVKGKTETEVVTKTVVEQIDLPMGNESKSSEATKRKRGGGRASPAETTPDVEADIPIPGNTGTASSKRKTAKANSRDLVQTSKDKETTPAATVTDASLGGSSNSNSNTVAVSLEPLPLPPTSASSKPSDSDAVPNPKPEPRHLPKRKQQTAVTTNQLAPRPPLYPDQEVSERDQTANATKPVPRTTTPEISEASRGMAMAVAEIDTGPVAAAAAGRGRKRGRAPAASIPDEVDNKLIELPLSEATVMSKDTTTRSTSSTATTAAAVRNKRGGRSQASQEEVVEEEEEKEAAVNPSGGGGRSSRRKDQPPPAASASTATTLPALPTPASTPIKSQSQVSASSTDSEIRLIFTGIEKDQRSADKIGAVVVDDPKTATHMITVLPLKRTPKLMIAINYGIKYILSELWLADSVKAKQPVDLTKPRSCSKYLLVDEVKEKLWGFSMIQTLRAPRGPQAAGGGGVFSGLAVFICEGVCGQGAPPTQEMKAIIESGGGLFLDRIPSSSSSSSSSSSNRNRNSSKEADDNMKKLVVIANEAVVSAVPPLVRSLAAAGPGKGIYSTEFIFLTVLRQKLDFNIEILEDFSCPPPSKRKKAI